jgi:hypothetical protein
MKHPELTTNPSRLGEESSISIRCIEPQISNPNDSHYYFPQKNVKVIFLPVREENCRCQENDSSHEYKTRQGVCKHVDI